MIQHLKLEDISSRLTSYSLPLPTTTVDLNVFMIMNTFRYRICLNISPGFYFFPGSGDPASKRDRPLFGTGIYKIRDYTLSFRWTGNARAALLQSTHFRFCNHRYGSKISRAVRSYRSCLGYTNGGRPDNGVSVYEGIYSRP